MRLLLCARSGRALLALEITGRVSSLTSSTSGPATFINDSNSMYTAVKPMEVDLHGIRLGQTEVEVYNQTTAPQRADRFRRHSAGEPAGPATWPATQHDQKEPELSREVKEKVAAKVQTRIDTEANAKLGQVAKRLQEKVFAPLDVLALDPRGSPPRPTDRRVVARIRLAGKDQLGSHTPRPQAPADCLASFQMHESVIHNVVERLALDGRTFTLPELSRHVAHMLSRPEPVEDNPEHNNVLITFATKDAVRVRARKAIWKSRSRSPSLPPNRGNGRTFRCGLYRPEINGRSAELARDGVIQLSGSRLTTGSQIAAATVFSRAFSKKTPLVLTPERLATDPNLADVGITQFVVDDGWVAVALGVRHTALRPGLLRK